MRHGRDSAIDRPPHALRPPVNDDGYGALYLRTVQYKQVTVRDEASSASIHRIKHVSEGRPARLTIARVCATDASRLRVATGSIIARMGDTLN